MRWRPMLAALVLMVPAALIALTAFSAHTGYVHINPEYWPAFAYTDGGYVQVHDCITQDMAGAINAWNPHRHDALLSSLTASVQPRGHNRGGGYREG